MSIQAKIIKKRIHSIENIGKITKAMEMVSSYKMKRAVEHALATRDYAKTALELLMNISREKMAIHPLLEQREAKKILMIVFASNKGLCGSYNSNVLKKVDNFVESHKEAEISFITIGKKAESRIKKKYGNYVASFIDIPENPQINDIFPFAKIAINGFMDKTYDKVTVIYTDFISPVKCEAIDRKLLPVSEKVLQELIERIEKQKKIIDNKKLSICLFEPDMKSVLDEVLPHLTEIQLYQSLLEANASEHSLRMITMKNASENASEMVDELTLSFNQARQAMITQEITEIASGTMLEQ